MVTDELMTYRLVCNRAIYTLEWLTTLTDDNQIKKWLLPYLQTAQPSTMTEIKATVPIAGIRFVHRSEAPRFLLQGYISVAFEGGDETDIAVIPLQKQQYRAIEEPKVEFSELGPFEAFTESLEINLYMMRRRLPIDRMRVRNMQLDNGRLKAALVYLNDSEPDALKMENKVKDVIGRYSANVLDSSTLAIAQSGLGLRLNNVNLLTEHPVQCIRHLLKGRIVMLMEGSRQGMIMPTSLSDYFKAPSDYLVALPFVILIRMIRIVSFVLALTLLPMYVAIVNFHYQMMPSKVIETLYMSRYAVPFPAFVEAFMMEIALLVLLEAVARLPTKLSQSAGVVAGIVLGTAAVEAGLISNIMIVIMGATALFTLTSASISLRNTVFVYNLPALVLANILGINGILLFWFLFIARLLQLKSLDRPFATFGLPQLADFLKRSD